MTPIFRENVRKFKRKIIYSNIGYDYPLKISGFSDLFVKFNNIT